MSGNSVMSAPAAKKNGFPVITAARKSPCSSSSSARSHDSSAASPKNVGFVQSSPLSIVTSATSATRVDPVRPHTYARPNRKIADENEPSRKYLMAPSVESESCFA